MTSSSEASILDLLDEPWYVIVGILVVVIVLLVAEKRLKAAGKWPNTGDNFYLDNLIWMAILLPIAVVGGLIAHALG